MRYLVPGSADDFPRCIPARLIPFGPWSAQCDPNGAVLTALDWPGIGEGEPRKTPEGWAYWPDEKPPSLHQLRRPNMVEESSNWVRLACGESILIRPAYLEPRKVFTNGDVGDPITDHGRLARKVMDLLRQVGPDGKRLHGVMHPDALKLWTQAIAVHYRAPPEVLDDSPTPFSIEDVDNVIAGVFEGPKPPPGAGSSPSPSPG